MVHDPTDSGPEAARAPIVPAAKNAPAADVPPEKQDEPAPPKPAGWPRWRECLGSFGRGEPVRKARGEVLYLEGARALNLYSIETGRVALLASTPRGQEIELFDRTAGSVIGLEALFQGWYLTSAHVAAPSSLRAFRAVDIRQGARQHPGRLWSVCRELVNEIKSLEKTVLDLGTHTALQRLAGFLLEEARGNGDKVLLPRGSKGMLARRLGISQETLSRLFQQLHEGSVITSCCGGLHLEQPERLQALVQGHLLGESG